MDRDDLLAAGEPGRSDSCKICQGRLNRSAEKGGAVRLRSSIGVLVNRIGSTHSGRLALRKGEGEGEDHTEQSGAPDCEPLTFIHPLPSPRGEAKRAKRIVNFFGGEATRDVRGRFI